MKKSIILAAAVAALAIFASCQKEELESASSGNDLVFTATIDNPATRTTVNTDASDTENRGKVEWENDDEITISDGTNTAVYSISAIDGTTGKATFAYKSGQTLATSGVTYTAIYGSEPLTAQTYSADVTDLPMTATSETTSLKFSVTCGLLKLTLTKTGESVKSIEVTGIPTGGSETTCTLSCTDAVSIASGADFFIALPAGTYTKFVITDSEGKVSTINSTGSGLAIEANKIQPLSFQTKLTFFTGTAKAKLDGTNEVDVTWVQLWEGGPKWATINVGVTDVSATGEDLYGGLYRWGGTNEKRANISLSDDHNTGSANLAGIYDTATNLWGSYWRMPTKAELQALIDNCTWSSCSSGYIVTGKNSYASNSIFLPAAGVFATENTLRDVGNAGYYWSSTHIDSSANYLYFGDSRKNTDDGGYPQCGCNVRAVLNETPATTCTAKAKLTAGSDIETDVIWVQLWAGGPKWATINVGVTSISATGTNLYGDYFAWGETAPYYKDGVWSTSTTWGGTSTAKTGYNYSNYCGNLSFTEWSTLPYDESSKVLKSTYDAATANWGANWRMPTVAEQNELISNCTCTWTSNYNGTGVSGCIFTSQVTGYTGNSIFLPAAGYRSEDRFDNNSSKGYYWSSSLYGGYQAYNLSFDSTKPVTNERDRCYGRSVRPVLSE